MKQLTFLIVLAAFSIGSCSLAQPAPISTSSPKSTLLPAVTQTSSSTSTSAPRELGVGSTTISEKDGMILVYVPAGEFTMGSESDNNDDEKPVRSVNLDAFWIDQTEVTNSMYAKCVVDDICPPPSSTKSDTRDSYYGNSKFDNYPVIYVDWDMANTYCEWADRRLPTEAEWEKAARGTDERTYPWGNDMPNNNGLNYNNSVGDTTEVGIYPDGASPYHALDMAGNVWEWVADWYSESYYTSSPSSNPLGPASGRERVFRGGAWDYDYYGVRSAGRLWNFPSLTYHNIGFRCAVSAVP